MDNFDDYYLPELKRHNISGALANEEISLVEGDIREPGLCRHIFRNYEVHRVVHLAARVGVRDSLRNPALYEQVNCQGTLNLLEAAREVGVKMFVFASSSGVYGSTQRMPYTPLSEDDPATEPISPYGATKRAGELFCHTYHHLYGIPVVCLRFFTVYGPRQRPDMAIARFVQRIERGQPIQMFGDGTSWRDYTYVDDIVDGILTALYSELEYEIINLGSAHPVRLRDLISMLEEALEKTAQIEQLPMQPGDADMTFAAISKARRLLDYEPKVPIEQGIRKFVKWLREGG